MVKVDDKQQLRRLDLLPRLLIAATGLPFVVLGVLAIVAERYAGHTKRGPTYLEGEPALAMGVVLLVLGLLPMAVLMPSIPAVRAWLLVWTVLFVGALWNLLAI